jgi:hypothetical protein
MGVVLEVLMQLDDDVAFHGMTSLVDGWDRGTLDIGYQDRSFLLTSTKWPELS